MFRYNPLMHIVGLLAEPWWVNLLLLVPAINFYYWRTRRHPLAIRGPQLLFAGLFAAAFGFVEGAVVVYLRAAVGLLPGYQGTLADVRRFAPLTDAQAQQIAQFPQSLLTVEVAREAATLLMLVAVAMLAAPRRRERWAFFLWCFAVWDIAYYAALWATIGWPSSFSSVDILFLIPVPWMSQVWYPILVSVLCMLAVASSREPHRVHSIAAGPGQDSTAKGTAA